MDTPNDIEHLLLRHLQGVATDEEKHLVMQWAAQAPDNQAVLDRIESEELLRKDLDLLFQTVDGAEGEARLVRMKAHILQTTKSADQGGIRHIKRTAWWRYVAAAALLIIAFGTYYYQATWEPRQASPNFATHVRPGSNRATLTLANGQTIDLSAAHTGIVIGADITYQDGSEVLENKQAMEHATSFSQLTLSTPKGGTYQLTLPDGTRVWLNAASTLKYPTRFDDKERVVELEGEAFFAVKPMHHAPDLPSVPFRVISRKQQVEVLGTQFNISAYTDEKRVKTTLVEGSVRVIPTDDHQSSVIIKPGEQVTTHRFGLRVEAVDTEPYIAWKDGRFHFKQTPLEEVLRQVSRWYDVEVVYKQGVPKETFSGKISRNASLTELLDILQLSAIHATLERNRLIIN